MHYFKLSFYTLIFLLILSSFVFGQTITDIDGNVYNTVTIGKQVWMMENLRTTKYRNGDAIPNVIDSLSWPNLTTGAYCNYNHNQDSIKSYGRLYNWYAVNDSRKIAPVGWHVATDADWTTLTTFLGGESIAGGKLKETGYSHWDEPNTGATNEVKFSALSAGSRSIVVVTETYGFHLTSKFNSIGRSSEWWTSTENNAQNAWRWIMYNNGSYIAKGTPIKVYGFSVRCIKDTTTVSVKQIDNSLPTNYELFQNYPNPFNPSTEISYQLPENSLVTLKIFNSLGQDLETLIQKIQSAGRYTVSWHPSNIPAGIYYYRLQTEKFSEVKKMLFIQ